LRVRPATVSDLPGAYEIFEATAAEGKWIGTELPIDRDARIKAWTKTVTEPGLGVMLVAEEAGEIVGSAGLTWSHRSNCGGGVLELGMNVAEAHRGRVIGKALLQAGLDWAREAGAHKVALQVWPHNVAARSLYARFGFEEEGYLRRHWRRRNGETWDAVIMGLLLDEG
jgi:RimJ/RimL family protein N-acetyltransferase